MAWTSNRNALYRSISSVITLILWCLRCLHTSPTTTLLQVKHMIALKGEKTLAILYFRNKSLSEPINGCWGFKNSTLAYIRKLNLPMPRHCLLQCLLMLFADSVSIPLHLGQQNLFWAFLCRIWISINKYLVLITSICKFCLNAQLSFVLVVSGHRNFWKCIIPLFIITLNIL